MEKLNVLRMALMPLFLSFISVPIVLLLLILSYAPVVAPLPVMSPFELAQLEKILLENAPESTSRASRRSISLDTEELNLLLRYGIQLFELSPRWASRVELSEGSLQLDASVGLAGTPFRFFLNLESSLSLEKGHMKLQQLKVGKLALPARILEPLQNLLIQNLAAIFPSGAELAALTNHISDLQISPAAMKFDIQWQPELIARVSNQVQQLFVSDQDRRRIAHYFAEIINTINAIPPDIRAISLNALLIPLFTSAKEESSLSEDPVAENIAAFQALSIYLNREDIASIGGSLNTEELPEPRPVEVRLQRREDLAHHVVSIAAISSSAGSEWAQILSTTKEAYDARYRTGFSFSDLTANYVGVALAEFATKSDVSALEFQRRVIALTEDYEYMPVVDNNRDGLSEAAFQDQYQDRSSVQFNQRLAEIQASIAERPFFSNQHQVTD
tara:strand:- start:7976 stop:9310 length:1335 start_codon:yes stop_codon:yes gene_type:complete